MGDTTRRRLRGAGSPRLVPLCFWAGLFFGGLPTGLARAQDDGNSSDTAAARSLAVEGLKLAEAGRCAEALDKLTRAEKLHHGPIVLARLGECQVLQGKVVEGTENLRKVLREPLPANPTPALLKARERAQTVLDSAKPRIAALTVSVAGPANNQLTVTLDGQPLPAAVLDVERPTDPGEHALEASAPGYLKTSSRVSLRPGEKETVTLKLEVDPNYVSPAASSASSAEAQSSSTRGAPSSEPTFSLNTGGSASPANASPNRTGAYVTWGISGALVVTGAAFGIMAMKGKSDLTNDCPGSVCPPSQKDNLDSANRSATISTVLFAAGGVGAALGAILYIAASPSGRGGATMGSAPLPAKPAPSNLRARAFVGPGQVGLSGTF
jgi:hypothetical protein